MSSYIHREALLFFLAAGAGAALLAGYDLLLALRRVIRHSPFFVALEDLLYWISVGFLTFAGIYCTNEGSLRGFLFLGIFLGAWLWGITVNPFMIRLFAGILGFPVSFGKKITKRLLFSVKRCKIFLYLSAGRSKLRERGRFRGKKSKLRGFKGSRKVGNVEKKFGEKTNEE